MGDLCPCTVLERKVDPDYSGGRNCTWRGDSKTLVLSSLSYVQQEKLFKEVFEEATFIKVPQNQNGKSNGYAC